MKMAKAMAPPINKRKITISVFPLMRSQTPVITRRYPTNAPINTRSVSSWMMKVPVVAPAKRRSMFIVHVYSTFMFRCGLICQFQDAPKASYYPSLRCEYKKLPTKLTIDI
jgi:hypothetical protein